MLVLEHELVALRNVVEGVGVAETRIHLAFADELRDVGGLRVVGEMAALEALLAHPVIAEVHRRSVAGGAGADDDHAAGRADENRRRQRRFTWMLEDDPRADSLAEAVPGGLAECPRAFRPFAVGLRALGAGHHAPVGDRAAVDAGPRAVLLAEFAFRIVGDARHRAPADRARDLERHAAETASGSPHEDDVAGLDHVWRPAHEHPVGRRGAEQKAARFLPGQALRLCNALMGLAAGELAEASVVGLVAPDARALGEHRVLARAHPGVVGAPPATVHDHFITDPDAFHVPPDGPDDSRAVAAAGVKVLGLARPLALGDHVERRPQGRPDVVVVDARGPDVDQHLVRTERRRRDDLVPPGIARLTEAVLSNEVRVHPRRDLAEWRSLSELAKVGHALNPLSLIFPVYSFSRPRGPGFARARLRGL